MIKVGAKVRSFDFACGEFGRELVGEADSERAAYVEGVVKGIGDIDTCAAGCLHYYIRVDVDVMGGRVRTDRVGKMAYPPVISDVVGEPAIEVIE